MYYTSKSNSDLKYHNKALNYLKEELKFLPFDFTKEDCILSGSLIIKALFKPKASYKDIDFYFESEQKKEKVATFLIDAGYKVVADTNNATTYDNGINKQVQLIKLYADPRSLVHIHDFSNVSICFSKNIFYINVKTFSAWKKNKLSINNFPWHLIDKPQEFKAQVIILLGRIEKYCKRYNLTLDSTFLKNILKLDKTSLPISKLNQIEFSIHYEDYNGVVVTPLKGGILNKVIHILQTYYPHYQEKALYRFLK